MDAGVWQFWVGVSCRLIGSLIHWSICLFDTKAYAESMSTRLSVHLMRRWPSVVVYSSANCRNAWSPSFSRSSCTSVAVSACTEVK